MDQIHCIQPKDYGAKSVISCNVAESYQTFPKQGTLVH